MAFHAQVGRSFRRAAELNLSREELWRVVVTPWQAGQPVELGDREWEPDECDLVILEGPELEGPDLALGQGWNNAERSAIDVTTQVLAEAAEMALAAVAIVAESERGASTVAALLDELGVPQVVWATLRARLLAGAAVVADQQREREKVVAVLVAEQAEPDGAWLFDAGLAPGALGGRAVLVRLGDQTPPREVQDLAAVRLDLQQPASRQALAERLRAAGCRVANDRG